MNRSKCKEISVLGVVYKVQYADLNSREMEGADGMCDLWGKVISLREQEFLGDGTDDAEAIQRRADHVIYHELIHAFAEESGSPYAYDEALTDWVATMIPKINAAFEQVKE